MNPADSSKSRPLTAAAILSASNGDHSDPAVAGLMLRVRGTAASWVLRYTSPTTKRADSAGITRGVRREIGLGSARRESLEAAETAARTARARALQMVAEILLGKDPADDRRTQRTAKREAATAAVDRQKREVRKLGTVVTAYHEQHIEGFDPKSKTRRSTYDPKTVVNWIGRMRVHLLPYLHSETRAKLWDVPIDRIEAQQLADFILHVQKKSPAVAKKLRQGLDQVFEHAALKKWVPRNIVADIRRTTRLRSTRAQRIAASRGFVGLPYPDAPDVMQALRCIDSTAARCLELIVLTAARPSEVREARWAEFDLDAGTWDIAPERMKASPLGHRVFLSKPAIALLRARRELDPVFVFPSPARSKHQPISEMAIYQPLKRLGMKGRIHVHGFRKTFSTWANETGTAHHDVIEAALAHRDPDEIRRTYNLAAHFEKRRALMQAWADYLSPAKQPDVDNSIDDLAAKQDAAAVATTGLQLAIS